ncbi:MAG: ATP-binding protein, partial [Lachnospiraceae bacterium]|nr:ATP-binding protein [Lachnospiraceae bacterium]
PSRPSLDRLSVFLGFHGTEEALSNAEALFHSSPLFKLYRTTTITEKDGKFQELTQCAYQKCCALTKQEIFLRPSAETGEEYYTVAEWEPNDEGRNIALYHLMEALDQPVLVRMDLYPVAWGDRIRNAFSGPTEKLKDRQVSQYGKDAVKDYKIDTILRSYEHLAEGMDGTPKFRLNLFAFGPAMRDDSLCDDVELLLDTLASDAIEKGDYSVFEVRTEGGSCHTFSFLDEEIAAEFQSGNVTRFIRPTRASGYEIADLRCKENILRFLPTLFTLEEVSPMFQLPVLNEGDTIELRKETAPGNGREKESLFLGTDDHGYPVSIPLKLLPKHAFIAGVPGSGKTNLMHHLVSALWLTHKIPFLVFEPAKQEYRALLNMPQPGMKEITLFSPNADMRFPLHINPFEFPKGMIVSEHIRNLDSVFEGAFPLEPPMPFLLDRAIEAVYRAHGWLPEMRYTTENAEKIKKQRGGELFPTMSELYEQLEKELESTDYSQEVSGNMKSALQVRIGSLLNREMGDVFDVPFSTFSPEDWLEKPAIIETEAMGEGPANFTMLLVCTLIRETLRMHPAGKEGPVRHVIFLEEAHNLIGPESRQRNGEADPKTAATAFLVKMLAEVRALKEAIVIADQLPTVMADEVLKNTGLKIGLRITAQDDRSLLGGTMSASAIQLEEMGIFGVGRALISYEGLQKPFALQTHEWLGVGDASTYIEDRSIREETARSKNDEDLQKLLLREGSYLDTIRRHLRCEGSRAVLRIRKERSRIREAREHLEKGAALVPALTDGLKPDLEEIRREARALREQGVSEQRPLLSKEQKGSAAAAQARIHQVMKSPDYREFRELLSHLIESCVMANRKEEQWKALQKPFTEDAGEEISLILKENQQMLFAEEIGLFDELILAAQAGAELAQVPDPVTSEVVAGNRAFFLKAKEFGIEDKQDIIRRKNRI